MIDDLVRPTTEISRVIQSVARGDLTQKMALTIEGQPVKGEFSAIGTTVNEMVDQLGSFADEVTRVAREVGTDGKLGGQAQVKGVVRHVARPHRERQLDGVEPHRPGAPDRRRHDRRRQRRPLPEDHRRRARRDPRAQGHDQHDGRPALVVRRRGHARRARGRHRGPARRPGRGQGRQRHVARPHRERELHGVEPHRPGAPDRRRHDRRRAAATSRRRSPSRPRARSRRSPRRSTR